MEYHVTSRIGAEKLEKVTNRLNLSGVSFLMNAEQFYALRSVSVVFVGGLVLLMEMMLGELSIIGTIGKAERGEEAVKTIKKYKSVYLSAVGGAAYLVSKSITSSRVAAFPELGMEAIYEFEVKDMPVMVSVDSHGKSIYAEAPLRWKNKSIPLKVSL
jgi:hypothetical protein